MFGHLCISCIFNEQWSLSQSTLLRVLLMKGLCLYCSALWAPGWSVKRFSLLSLQLKKTYLCVCVFVAGVQLQRHCGGACRVWWGHPAARWQAWCHENLLGGGWNRYQWSRQGMSKMCIWGSMAVPGWSKSPTYNFFIRQSILANSQKSTFVKLKACRIFTIKAQKWLAQWSMTTKIPGWPVELYLMLDP